MDRGKEKRQNCGQKKIEDISASIGKRKKEREIEGYSQNDGQTERKIDGIERWIERAFIISQT